MSGQDHALAAMRLLNEANERTDLPWSDRANLIAQSQTHATLALVAVMAMGPGANAPAWRPVFGNQSTPTFDEGA
jgi:hypothetical protein